MKIRNAVRLLAVPAAVGLITWHLPDRPAPTSPSLPIGTYRAEVVLPPSGTWRVQVSLRVGEFENPVASLVFRVPRGGR